ncbi:MAG: hypothetical protein ACO1PQ_18705, partial [Rhizobium sp.]
MTLTISNVAAGESLVISGSSVLLSDGRTVDIDGIGTAHVSFAGSTATITIDRMNLDNTAMQALVDGLAYAGAPGDAPAGGTRTVTISQVTDNGEADSIGSRNSTSTSISSTITLVPANDAPTGSVEISGNATEDQVLTADTSKLSDPDGLGTLHYQWQRYNGSTWDNIGADQATYTLGKNDAGHSVRVVVSYTDGTGFSESVTSGQTDEIEAVNHPVYGGLTRSGRAAEDEMMAVGAFLFDEDGVGDLRYDWQRLEGSDWVSTGGNQTTYRFGDADAGHQMRVVVSYTDGRGNPEKYTYGVGTVAAVNDDPEGALTIDGDRLEGKMLSVNAEYLTDADGLGTPRYEWQRDTGGGWETIPGADSSSYRPGASDINAQFRVVMSYTDGQGFFNSVTSAATGPIGAVNDGQTGGVNIYGTTSEKGTLQADTSGLTDPDGLGTFRYDWQRFDGTSWVSTNAPDQPSYALSAADVGGKIRVVVSYTDGQGFEESVTSGSIDNIEAVNDGRSGSVTIFGTTSEKGTLQADTSGLTDPDGLGTFRYDWQRFDGTSWVSTNAPDQP